MTPDNETASSVMSSVARGVKSGLQRLSRPLKRQTLRPLPLKFTVSQAPSDKLQLRTYSVIDGNEEEIEYLDQLSEYGYRQIVETPREIISYVPDAAHLAMLSALRDRQLETQSSGIVETAFSPALLHYLRKQPGIHESKQLADIQISEEALEPGCEIDFFPQRGIFVRTGYKSPNGDGLMLAAELQQKTEHGYVKIGATYYPVATSVPEETRRWLQRSIHHIPISQVPEFYIRDLAYLRRELGAVVSERAQQLSIETTRLTPVIYLNKEDGGWLSFNVAYEVKGKLIPHEQLWISRNKEYFRLDDDTWIPVNANLLRRTQEALEKTEGIPNPATGYQVPASQFAALEDLVDRLGGQSEMTASYQEFLEQLNQFTLDENFPLKPDTESELRRMNVRLRPYQRAGISWMVWLQENRLHGLLADDMGLGKTLQSILTMRFAYDESGANEPSLIIAPLSVMTHWERELERFFSETPVYRYHGSNRTLAPLRRGGRMVVLSTYDTVRSSIYQLAQFSFYYVILDEATAIKNTDSKRSKAIKSLNSLHRLSLTGTPVENRPAELWSLYDFLMPGHLGSFGTFERTFEGQIIAGNTVASKRLGRRIRPFLLRRMKEEVARDLPEKIEMDEWCQLTAEQRQIYASLQDAARPTILALQSGGRIDYATSILPLLTKLKQVCDHPAILSNRKEPLHDRSEKFDWIVNRIDEILNRGEQVVVFSHFLGMLDLLENSLKAKRVELIRIDGSTQERQSLIDGFNAGDSRVALFSIRAAGHGINVTAANHVIHADRWWNPAVENQATDRVHRIGQTKTVYVYRIMVENTLEERIDRLLRRKQEMADQIIGHAREGGGNWTREELLEILRPID